MEYISNPIQLQHVCVCLFLSCSCQESFSSLFYSRPLHSNLEDRGKIQLLSYSLYYNIQESHYIRRIFLLYSLLGLVLPNRSPSPHLSRQFFFFSFSSVFHILYADLAQHQIIVAFCNREKNLKTKQKKKTPKRERDNSLLKYPTAVNRHLRPES